jgi:hypothetical protein
VTRGYYVSQTYDGLPRVFSVRYGLMKKKLDFDGGGRSYGGRTNGALGRRLVILARGLPVVYLMDSRDAALVAVTELNSS